MKSFFLIFTKKGELKITTIESDAEKAQLAREILNLENIDAVRKLKQAYRHLPAKEESEFISKEEVLAGIESGLRDLKAGRKTPAREFLNELREEV